VAPESATGDFGSVLSLMREATVAMVERRDEADAKAKEAISAIESALISVLNGEAMRGLTDLGGKIYGLRIGVDGSAFARLPVGKPTLILDAHGMLVVATLVSNGSSFVQRAPIGGGLIRASLLVPYVRAVQTAIDTHTRSARQRTREFEKILKFSRKIDEIMRSSSTPPE
jgi:hypothetical protein